MRKFEVGKVLRAKGLDGTMKCSYATDDLTEIESVKHIFIDGKKYEVLNKYAYKGDAYFKVSGIEDCDQANALKDKTIEVEFEENLQDGEYYITDLIGAEIVFANKKVFGKVLECENYGASEVLTIATTKGEVMVPVIPNLIIEFKNKQLVVDEKVLKDLI